MVYRVLGKSNCFAYCGVSIPYRVSAMLIQRKCDLNVGTGEGQHVLDLLNDNKHTRKRNLVQSFLT